MDKEEKLVGYFQTSKNSMTKDLMRTRVSSIAISDMWRLEHIFHVMISFVRLIQNVTQGSSTDDIPIADLLNNQCPRHDSGYSGSRQVHVDTITRHAIHAHVHDHSVR